MTEESLGRAVAVAALGPIARHETDQREREERQEREGEELEARIEGGLSTSADLDEIVRRLAVADSRARWSESQWMAWKTLARSGALKATEMELVCVRFRQPPLGGQIVAELWRRLAWSSDYEGDRWWLDIEASLWKEEKRRFVVGTDNLGDRLMGRSRNSQLRSIDSLGETNHSGDLGEFSSDDPTAWVKNSKFLEKTFVVEVDHPIELTSHTVMLSKRRRYWRFSGGLPLKDLTNWTEASAIMAHIASASLPGSAAKRSNPVVVR
jgi:hypothetical protein